MWILKTGFWHLLLLHWPWHSSVTNTLDFHNCRRCIVVLFNLQLPPNMQCWASFHIAFASVYIFLVRCSLPIYGSSHVTFRGRQINWNSVKVSSYQELRWRRKEWAEHRGYVTPWDSSGWDYSVLHMSG